MCELSNTTINGVSYDFKDAGAARQSHSHTKSQITDFPTSMPASDVSAWAKASTKPTYTASEVGAIATTAKGAASGVAELDANGKVPSSQLPSFVDDVLEYSAKSSFPTTGETGKIYVDTSNNKTYRWSGSAYVEISPSLALGETSSTAYRGDRGKAAYDHSQTTSGNPHNTTAADTGAVPNTSAGVSAAINLLSTGDSAPTDNDYYVSQYAGGGTSTTTYHRRPVSKLWEYIKSKLASKGSATQPVYFSNGVPVATTYTLGKSVPSDAKFTDTTYSAATTSSAGLMSATDKSKLDGIASGATKTTVDSALSSTSTNPVQNKVINTALAGKASTAVATTSADGLMSSGDKSIVNSLSNSTWRPIVFSGATLDAGGYMMFGKLCLLNCIFTANTSGFVYIRNLPSPLINSGPVHIPIYNNGGSLITTFRMKSGTTQTATGAMVSGTGYYVNAIYMTA